MKPNHLMQCYWIIVAFAIANGFHTHALRFAGDSGSAHGTVFAAGSLQRPGWGSAPMARTRTHIRIRIRPRGRAALPCGGTRDYAVDLCEGEGDVQRGANLGGNGRQQGGRVPAMHVWPKPEPCALLNCGKAVLKHGP